MAERVVARVPDIVEYAGKLSNFGSGTAKGKDTGKDSIFSTSTTAQQSLAQMSKLSLALTPPGPEVFQEARLAAGYLAVNVESFKQFISACTKGIQCSAMAAQAVATILNFTDGVSAAEMANIVAYAEGDPSAKRPDGIPTDALGTKTQMDMDIEAAENQANQPDAIANPDDPNAQTFDVPEGGMTTTRYADGSYRVVSYYTTFNADGSTTTHTQTKYYKANGDEIANSGETEDTEVGNGYQTVTRHEGNTTSSTTTHSDGGVDVKTTTQDGQGKNHTTEDHFGPPKSRDRGTEGPIQKYAEESKTDGSSGTLGGAYPGY